METTKPQFDKELIDFGQVQVGKKLRAIFTLLDDNIIENVKTGCGCTNAQISNNRKSITVNYTAEQIPHHLLQQGFFRILKSVDAIVLNPTNKHKQTIKLQFKAEIHKNL